MILCPLYGAGAERFTKCDIPARGWDTKEDEEDEGDAISDDEEEEDAEPTDDSPEEDDRDDDDCFWLPSESDRHENFHFGKIRKKREKDKNEI